MKVGIIGAGLAGLSCAHELERYGITPDIFEMNDFVGEQLDLSAISMHMFNTPINNPLKYLAEKHEIKLIPHYNLNEIVMVSPKKSYTAKGNLGFIFRRSAGSCSMRDQILQEIKAPIKLNTFVDADDIKNDYDYVLVATGNSIYPQRKDYYKEAFNAYTRIATIKGHFKTDSVTIWFNMNYAKHGFGYQVSDTTEYARLILVVNNVAYLEFERYWNAFIKDCLNGNEITDTIDLVHQIGFVSPLKRGNVYLAGNAAGQIDSLLGFGTLKSIISGVSAGHCMANKINYNEYMKKHVKPLYKIHEMRKAFNSLDNDGIEHLLAIINLPVIKNLMYNNPLYKATQPAPILKLYNAIKQDKSRCLL